MDTIVYWLLVLGYYLLGVIVGLMLLTMLYPPIRTFPMTVLYVWSGFLKPRAIAYLISAMVFPIVLLIIGFFLINLLTHAVDVVKSRSFLVGILGTALLIIFSGGLRAANYAADYAAFMQRHSTIPEGVTPLHILIATNTIQYCMANYDDPSKDEKFDELVEHIKSLEFNEDDNELLLMALKHVKAKDDEIDLAMELFSNQLEYVEWKRDFEIQKQADELRYREDEEQQKSWDEEIEKLLAETDEEETQQDT